MVLVQLGDTLLLPVQHPEAGLPLHLDWATDLITPTAQIVNVFMPQCPLL